MSNPHDNTNQPTQGQGTNAAMRSTAAAAAPISLKADVSLTRVAIRETLRPWISRVAIFWVGLVVFIGLYAPFLANSHPYLMLQDGKLSSPLLANLTQWDVILALLIPIIFLGRLVARKWLKINSLFVVLGMLIAVMTVSLLTVKPSAVPVYDKYRIGLSEGSIKWAVTAPVPFSKHDLLQEQSGVRYRPPSTTHWMGTEGNGADICAQIIHACRIAMSTGIIASSIAVTIGVILGGLMGYFSGWVDLIGMRVVEVFSAIPTIYLILTVMAAFGTRNIYLVMVIIGLTSWEGYALFTRAEFLRLRQADFVQAGIAAGLPLRSILFVHILPNGMAPILISFTFGIAGATLTEAGLSFIGLGDAQNPSWGGLLNQAVSGSGGFYWWLASFPGLAIFCTIFSYNILGEALRDALDPRLAHTRSE